MNKCFGCLRHIRFFWRSRFDNKKWLTFIEHHCSQNSRQQWCELIMENYSTIKQFTNPSEQTFRELKSTNIASEVLLIMKKDCRQENNLISFLCDVFASYTKNKYTDIINPSHSTINKLAKDNDNFIDFIRSLLVIYYELQEREVIGDDKFFHVTLSNFVQGCLFEREEFNNSIGQVLKNNTRQAQERINFNIQKFSSLEIKDYDVNVKFSLDEKTLEYFHIQNLGSVPKPFSGAIQMVKEIVRVRNPYEKLKHLENLIRQVQFSIMRFYEQNKIKEPIAMDADSAISILLYILVQASQNQLLFHVLCIENFVRKQVLEGGSGYCLATLKACLQFLEKGNIKRSKGLNIPESQFSLWINIQNYFEHITNNDL